MEPGRSRINGDEEREWEMWVVKVRENNCSTLRTFSFRPRDVESGISHAGRSGIENNMGGVGDMFRRIE